MSKLCDLTLGAHTSTAGGLFHALREGHDIGATTIQLFTANQRQWKSKPLTEEAIGVFRTTVQQTKMSHLMSHASYLINLGTPDPLNLKKSRDALAAEIERCQLLGLSYLNVHPGAALGRPIPECLDRIIESLLLMEEWIVDDSLTLLLETTAGQGSCVGASFEELAYILERTHHRIPIGVCMDTCHVFAAGYGVRSGVEWVETLSNFDRICGADYLRAFHLNDSVCEQGSRKDRHATLGEGQIGMGCFHYLVTHQRTAKLPMYLETPGGPAVWDKEIARLRSFAKDICHAHPFTPH